MRWNKRMNGHPLRRSERPSSFNGDGMRRDVIVIGASAGGVSALSELFAALPPRLPAAIGVVLHRSASPGSLAHVLGRRSALPVIEPRGTNPLKHGVIYLAPPDHHLLFEHRGVVIYRGPKEHSTRPAIDPLFRSAATHYGRRVLGIVLTGCGEDGVSGLIAISQFAGITLAQDPDDAYMPYMPMNALQYDEVTEMFALRDMAAVIKALAEGQPVSRSRKRNREQGVPLSSFITKREPKMTPYGH
jgi:two-component system, chemotaxis family, protein-glutamate methylesterase/glutaminase